MVDISPPMLPSRTIKVLGFSVDLRALVSVIFAYMITRFMVFLVIYLSSITIPMHQGEFPYASPNNILIDGLVRDDSWWYTNIVTQGYNPGNIETGQQGNVAFFPFYPLLVRVMMGVTGDVFTAGVLVSNASFLVALYYLYRLVKLEFGEEVSKRTVFYYAAAPTAVFFSAMYTESTYMALVCATFYFARQGIWDKAGLAGMLAAATRNTGVLMMVFMALECFRQSGGTFRPKVWRGSTHRETLILWRNHIWQQIKIVFGNWRGVAASIYVAVGLLAYMVYLANRFGDPLAFIHVQATWGRSTSPAGALHIIGNTLTGLKVGNLALGQINAKTFLDVFATLGFLPIVIATVRYLRPSYAVYTVLTFLVPLSTGTTGSMTRYILMLIPCFMLLGVWGRNAWVERIILGIFLPLLAYFTVLFSHWYFAG